MQNDHSIKLLGEELNLRPDSTKAELKVAVPALIKRLPYYSTIEKNGYSEIIPVRLVRTTTERIYKVLPETNIINLINTIINDKIFKGIKLPLNKYIYMESKIGITMNMCEFSVYNLPKNKYLNEEEYWNSNLRIQYLMDRQLPNVPIYSFWEISENQSTKKQIAYIFTISEINSIMTIILENTCVNTATYFFEVSKNFFEEAISQIINYFGSERVYKRAEFLNNENTVFSENNGFINRGKFIHWNLINWMKDIELKNIR